MEEKLAKIEADRVAAEKVTDQINALPSTDKITAADRKAIEAARAKYNALNDAQKAQVSAEAKAKLEEYKVAIGSPTST